MTDDSETSALRVIANCCDLNADHPRRDLPAFPSA
jgi:hypothetical protein